MVQNTLLISDIAKKIIQLSKKNIKIKYDTTKPEGDMDSIADPSKAKEILKWSPKVSLNDGLRDVFDWCSNKLS